MIRLHHHRDPAAALTIEALERTAEPIEVTR